MTLPKAMAIGAILGTSFCLAAMLTDLAHQHRLPRVEVFTDPAMFLETLRKATTP